jgi:hypothetical protein
LDGRALSVESLHCAFSLFSGKVRSPTYFFVPGPTGPWSFQLEADLKKLSDGGWVEEEAGAFRSKEGQDEHSSLDPQTLHALRSSIEELGEDPLKQVLEKEPFQGISLPERMLLELSDDELRERIERVRPASPRSKLFTIGYEGRPLEVYMKELLRNRVQVLCDVRKDPVSRKFGFSRKMLEHASSFLGMRYLHFPGLGIPKEERRKVEGEEDREALLENYERSVLPKADTSLEELSRSIREEAPIALTCYEADPSKCHRSRVAKALTDQGKVQEPLHL